MDGGWELFFIVVVLVLGMGIASTWPEESLPSPPRYMVQWYDATGGVAREIEFDLLADAVSAVDDSYMAAILDLDREEDDWIIYLGTGFASPGWQSNQEARNA